MPGSDRIDLSAIDANAAIAANQAFVFVEAVDTDVQANRVTWYREHGNTFIQADTDGDVSQAELFIRLDGLRSLTEGDFVL